MTRRCRGCGHPLRRPSPDGLGPVCRSRITPHAPVQPALPAGPVSAGHPTQENPMTDTTAITLDSSSIELGNGENLRALNVGDRVDLDAATGHGGTWTVAEFHGPYRERTTLRAAGVRESADPWADGVCTYGEDQAPGAGCIKPMGHDGAHCVVPGEPDED